VSTALDQGKLDLVADREPYVLLSVFPVTKAGFEDELYDHKLECHAPVAKIKDLQKSAAIIVCDKYRA